MSHEVAIFVRSHNLYDLMTCRNVAMSVVPLTPNAEVSTFSAKPLRGLLFLSTRTTSLLQDIFSQLKSTEQYNTAGRPMAIGTGLKMPVQTQTFSIVAAALSWTPLGEVLMDQESNVPSIGHKIPSPSTAFVLLVLAISTYDYACLSLLQHIPTAPQRPLR